MAGPLPLAAGRPGRRCCCAAARRCWAWAWPPTCCCSAHRLQRVDRDLAAERARRGRERRRHVRRRPCGRRGPPGRSTARPSRRCPARWPTRRGRRPGTPPPPGSPRRASAAPPGLRRLPRAWRGWWRRPGDHSRCSPLGARVERWPVCALRQVLTMGRWLGSRRARPDPPPHRSPPRRRPRRRVRAGPAHRRTPPRRSRDARRQRRRGAAVVRRRRGAAGGRPHGGLLDGDGRVPPARQEGRHLALGARRHRRQRRRGLAAGRPPRAR